MKKVYQVLAYVVAALVVVQAAAVAYGFFALDKYIASGHAVDQHLEYFPGHAGLETHGTAGVMVIPLVGLALVVVSFLAKIAGGVRWALIVFGTIVVQVLLGFAAHPVPALGMLHGIVAMALFGLAVTAAMRSGRVARAASPARTTSRASV